MRHLLPWVAILLVGLACLVAYPLVSAATSPAESARAFGVWPEWLVPVGYWTAAVGATGMVTAWIVHRARHPRRG